MKNIKKIAMVMIPVIVIGAGAFVLTARAAMKKAEKVAVMIEHERHGDEFIQDGDYDKALKEYGSAQAISKELKEKLNKERLGKKEKLAQLIVDGDKSFKSGDYEKAKKSYEKAKNEAAGQENFDVVTLDKKIIQAQSCISILDLIKEGDLKLESGDIEGAKADYQKAKLMALQSSFKDAQKELKTKLEDVSAEESAAIKEKSQLDAEVLEIRANECLASQEYEKAIEFYALALSIYQESGMPEKVVGIEKKIMKAEEKLNSTPANDGTEAEKDKTPKENEADTQSGTQKT